MPANDGSAGRCRTAARSGLPFPFLSACCRLCPLLLFLRQRTIESVAHDTHCGANQILLFFVLPAFGALQLVVLVMHQLLYLICLMRYEPLGFAFPQLHALIMVLLKKTPLLLQHTEE